MARHQKQRNRQAFTVVSLSLVSSLSFFLSSIHLRFFPFSISPSQFNHSTAALFPMASSLSSAFASPLVNSKSSPNSPHCSNSSFSTVSFRLSPLAHLRFSSQGQQPLRYSSTLVRAQSNEVSIFQRFSLEDLLSHLESFVESIFGSSDASKVAVDGSSNASTSSSIKPESPSIETKDTKQPEKPSTPALATEESVPQFMAQVSSLVKLVDSRDIVELHLKQHDFELVIRKNEALPQPVSPAPIAMVHPPLPLPQQAPPPAPPAASSAPPSPPATKPQKSSLPPLKCPMAGTFYRSPAPGEPPFVKVGDKVQKGQVICIIEAMKLMNEIEADQSGTIVEIIAEDGKPVSVDTPLFVIEP